MNMKEKINQYLAGDLEGKELEQFEAILASDSQLQAEVDRKDKLLEDSIRESVQRYELENMMWAIHEKVQKEKANERKEASAPPQKPKRNLIKWGIAAIVVIILLLLAYFLAPKASPPPSNPEQIYAQWENTIPTEFTLTNMGGANSLEQKKADAEAAFNQKDYSEAKTIFNQILQDTLIEQIIFGKGLCELHLGNYEAAIQDFEKIEASNVVFKTQAIWFKGLAYLKNGETDACRAVMENLVNNNSASPKEKENAQKLLEQLRQLE